MSVSVCTLVRGRETHLQNMLAALATQTSAPKEVIVAYMQAERPDVLDMYPEVKSVQVTDNALPLAAARNRAAALATGETLLFLDVDCVAHPGLVAAIDVAVQKTDAVVMGDVRYLPEGVDQTGPFDEVWRHSQRHPARPDPEAANGLQKFDMQELWSLCFALPRRTFERISGFDERFEGYGGEDTDFAARLGAAGAELFFSPDARAVHQWHPVHIPPLQHFDDILRNAELFRRLHGKWCMDYWLNQLSAAGFINWSPEGDRLECLRRPSASDLSQTRQPGTVLYS
ncbi:glycosyltransferase [Henriciella barbarensis]|uniref:Glycosyltransferase n=1 Tax=Henriciella barbarensis TaxID=86342 RepID=A0A399QS27_9PROT|nr:galactosyltransferase-related protein [Henriciella barbarensis]RIJ21648.1 glycosyltransferase [Henriciella barbarensis]